MAKLNIKAKPVAKKNKKAADKKSAKGGKKKVGGRKGQRKLYLNEKAARKAADSKGRII